MPQSGTLELRTIGHACLLVLEDGNHRVEALRRAGEERAWTVIAFPDDATRDRFIERAESAPT